jgi:ATP-dependent HslUV protease, peptidase subunit HslV
MGTLVAVRKNNEICIGSDCSILPEPWLTEDVMPGQHCIINVGDSYIGLSCSVAFQQAFESALTVLSKPQQPEFSSRQEIFNFFSRVHELIRDRGYMNTTFSPEQEFELTPMNAIIVNRHGIFRVDSARAVYQFSDYWAYGTGESFALGALAASFDRNVSAEKTARTALEAIAKFDSMAGKNISIFSLKAPLLTMAPSAKLLDKSSLTKKNKNKKKSSKSKPISLDDRR